MSTIFDHGHNDALEYRPEPVSKRAHAIAGLIGCKRAAEVLRNLDNARTGQQATAYTFDEVTAALRMGAAALEQFVV